MPTTWCAVFGGILYELDYYYRKDTNTELPATTTVSSGLVALLYPYSSTQTSLQSYSTTFLGVDLMHSSGFNVQIRLNAFAFMEKTSSWYISAGLPL